MWLFRRFAVPRTRTISAIFLYQSVAEEEAAGRVRANTGKVIIETLGEVVLAAYAVLSCINTGRSPRGKMRTMRYITRSSWSERREWRGIARGINPGLNPIDDYLMTNNFMRATARMRITCAGQNNARDPIPQGCNWSDSGALS